MTKSGVTMMVLFVLLILGYIGVFSALASYRKIPWQLFWGGSMAIMAPWIASTFVVVIASLFVPAKLQTAAGMVGMFPALAFCFTAVLAPIISLFASSQVDVAERVKWFAGISSIPAVLLTGFLIYIMIVDSLKDTSV